MPELNQPETLARRIEPDDQMVAVRIVDGQVSLPVTDSAQQFADRYRSEANATLAAWGKSSEISTGGQLLLPTLTWTDRGFEELGPWYGEIADIPASATGNLYVAQGRATKRGGTWDQTPWGQFINLTPGFVEWAITARGEGATQVLDADSHTHYRARLGDGTWSPWERITSTTQDRGWVTLVEDRDAHPSVQNQSKNFSHIYTDLDQCDTLRIIAKIYDGHDDNGARGEVIGMISAEFPVSEIEPLNHNTAGYHAGKTLRVSLDKDAGGTITHSRTDTLHAGAYQSRVAFRMHFERPAGHTSGRVVHRAALKRISWTGQVDHFSLSLLAR